ncbi:hypothetical protein T484DRAFT_1978661 [Baffinella frigidus]|nr:hypothetical protein T484DRAFT_1978661 [Cryptophyta sp. CCMP2293]
MEETTTTTTSTPPATTSPPTTTTTTVAAAPEPTTTAAPAVAADFTTYVEMVVSLPLSAAEFTSAKQANFLSGVAAAAGVSASSVEITAIHEVTLRRSASRRLLATSVEVDFRVAAADTAAAQSLASNLDATSLNAALAQQGLPKATVLKSAAVKSSVASATTTPTPSVAAPSPPYTDFTTYVEMVVSLLLSRAEFTSAKQTNFRYGIASAAGVAVSSVEITAIREVTSRRSASRRLLATSVEVDFRVAAADTAAAQSLATKLDATSLNAALKLQGLPEATVIKSATVISEGKEVLGGSTSNVGAIVGGVVAGLVVCIALVAAIVYYNRTRKKQAVKQAESSSLENAAAIAPSQPAANVAPPPPRPLTPPADLGLQDDDSQAAGVPLRPQGHPQLLPKSSSLLGDITPVGGRSFLSGAPLPAAPQAPPLLKAPRLLSATPTDPADAKQERDPTPFAGSGAAWASDATWATHGGVFAVDSPDSSGRLPGLPGMPHPLIGHNIPVVQHARVLGMGMRVAPMNLASLGGERQMAPDVSPRHMEPVVTTVEHESFWRPFNPTTDDQRRAASVTSDRVYVADMVFAASPPRRGAPPRAPPMIDVQSVQSTRLPGTAITPQSRTHVDVFGLQDNIGDA